MTERTATNGEIRRILDVMAHSPMMVKAVDDWGLKAGVLQFNDDGHIEPTAEFVELVNGLFSGSVAKAVRLYYPANREHKSWDVWYYTRDGVDKEGETNWQDDGCEVKGTSLFDIIQSIKRTIQSGDALVTWDEDEVSINYGDRKTVYKHLFEPDC